MVSPVPPPLLPNKYKKPSLLSSIIDSAREISISSTDPEEFDFSEVFGPLPSPHNAAPLTESLADLETSDQWCSTTDVLTSSEPAVICTRSHSFVGPSICTPRGSKSFRTDEQNPDGLPQSLREEVIRSCSDDSSSDGGLSDKAEGESVGERKIGPQDFALLRVVGQGAFGKVFQVQHVHTNEIFAMKVMKKDAIMEKNQGDYMRAERDILTKIVHPFIVQLRYSFQTKSKLYLILDFINGGHLFFQLYRQGTFSEDLAKIYTAEIIAAVSHLHENGIIHRDLKPENILLDAEGHVKLTDFGLAKEIDESTPTNSLCGTIEYMAPEILLANGHGKAADWWSVGILLYEMLTGQPPFTQKNRQKLQDKIVKDKVKLPSYLTSEVHSLLKGLLTKEPSKRLGSGPNKSDEIKQHKWFKSINWKKLEARQIQPKFRPEVNGMDCVANFDEKWTMLPPQDSPASTPKADDSAIFKGYTYVAPNTWITLLEEHTHGRS